MSQTRQCQYSCLKCHLWHFGIYPSKISIWYNPRIIRSCPQPCCRESICMNFESLNLESTEFWIYESEFIIAFVNFESMNLVGSSLESCHSFKKVSRNYKLIAIYIVNLNLNIVWILNLWILNLWIYKGSEFSKIHESSSGSRPMISNSKRWYFICIMTKHRKQKDDNKNKHKHKQTKPKTQKKDDKTKKMICT